MRLEQNAVLAYGIAFVCGLAFVAAYFPARVAFGLDVPDSILSGDVATNVAGQRYFIGDAWRWPVLVSRLVNPPHGVNIIFTDSIPAAALVAKLISPALPHPVTFVFTWLALCFVLQPAGAVYALRGTGERRVWPALCVAIIAICLPTLLYRARHVALCSHFLLLLALGVYLRTCRDHRPRPFASGTLVLGSLFVHAYIFVMVTATLVAAPLSLLLRGERAWRKAALALLPALLAAPLLAVLMGYGGASPGGGFGEASMNLLSPIYPAYSDLLQGVTGAEGTIDATGAQSNGYQYLGAGLLVLIAVAAILPGWDKLGGKLGRHAGLGIVCCLLTMLALSNRVYAGRELVLQLGPVPDVMQHFRGSGRFFWPVSYALLIGAVAIVCRGLSARAAAAVLLAATMLQVLDTHGLRGTVGARMKMPLPPVVDEPRLHALMARADRLTIWPPAACGLNNRRTPEFMATIVAASDSLLPVNTIYAARYPAKPDCDLMHIAGLALQPRELRVFMPDAAPAAAAIVPNGDRFCRALRTLSVCTLDEAALAGLGRPAAPAVATGQDILPFKAPGSAILAAGWSGLEPSGVWSLGSVATLAFRVPDPAPLRVTLSGWSLADRPGGKQHIRVTAKGRTLATWDVGSTGPDTYAFDLPPDLLDDSNALIRLDIGHPVRPIDMHIADDDRELGFFLTRVRIDQLRSIPQH